MTTSKKIISILIVFFAFISQAISKSFNNGNNADYIRHKKLYKTLIISDVESRNSEGALSYKIVVNEFQKNNTKNIYSLANQPKTEKARWSISTTLPLTEAQCNAAYADICDKDLNRLYRGSCYKPCISYGPELLDFDEKSGKLYFSAASTSIGTGGGPYFIFVGDINKKEIKYLKAVHGPVSGVISPLGDYLLLVGMSKITIYSTVTGKEFYITEKNNWDTENMLLHFFSNVAWLSDTMFRYYDGVRNSKFQKSFDRVKENVYDINSKSIVRTRVLSRNEID